MTRRITVTLLKSKCACKPGIDAFKLAFPRGLKVATTARGRAAQAEKASGLDTVWAADELLSGAAWIEYRTARADAVRSYERRCGAAAAEYNKAFTAARAEYRKALASAAAAEFDKVHAAAQAEQNKAHAAARAEYRAATIDPRAEYNTARALAFLDAYAQDSGPEGTP